MVPKKDPVFRAVLGLGGTRGVLLRYPPGLSEQWLSPCELWILLSGPTVNHPVAPPLLGQDSRASVPGGACSPWDSTDVLESPNGKQSG